MAGSKDKLRKYKEKRDPAKSKEPGDESVSFDWANERPIFVIQKHDASNLHYDLRLEVDGVLKSWAVPKGPATDPSEKRLAMPTEDHPLSYADFEGIIPKQEYGGGTVMIWDRGSYSDLGDSKTSVAKQLENGHIKVWLKGEKICGGYALTRTGSGKDDRWLLVKMDDDKADARRNPTSTETNSVASGRTMKEIEQEAGDE
ncbi:DNA polymerase ligase N-terminal domain-containing protein [Aliidiomarina sp. Khilg15.8]